MRDAFASRVLEWWAIISPRKPFAPVAERIATSDTYWRETR